MIVDIHCHYIPKNFLEFVEKEQSFQVRSSSPQGETVEVEVGTLKFRLNRTFFDPNRQMARMDELGIDRSVISLATPLINYMTPPDLAIKAARIFNDGIAELRDHHPNRFDGWAVLPMQAPSAAAMELDRAISKLGLCGGHIGSNVNGEYLDKPKFSPIFEAAADLKVPLFMHPTNPPGRERMKDYELTVVGGYLFDTTLSIFNMIFGGMLDRNPMLKLCCAHAGGYALLLRGRMQREIDTNPEIGKNISYPIAEYLKRLYYDTVCFETGYLKFVADVVGPEHLILGSDGPFPLGEPDPVRFIQDTFLDDKIGWNILHVNAARMFSVSDEGGNYGDS